MEILLNLLVLTSICGLITLVAYLKTELNIAENRIEDLEFLNDLRK